MKDCVVPENNHPPFPTEHPFTWKETLINYVKNAVVLYYYARVNIYFCDKERKNPFIHGSKLSNNPNFAL